MTSLPQAGSIRPAPSERALELPRPSTIALPETAPSIEELFAFMREAERRFRTLRMRVVERTQTAAGPTETLVELWLAHPGKAKVIENRPIHGVPTKPGGEAPTSYWVWVSDGERVRTFDSATNVATDRAHRHVPDEIDDPQLPAFARVLLPITELPMESLPEAFVHPAGLARNLATGPVTLVGQAHIAGREALVLEISHPRTTLIETDRSDRSVILGVDRETGVVTLLEERVGDVVTRRAEVTYLEPDAPIRDDVFTIHVPADAVKIF
jgi:hypothetical protein